jgi:hypothetical protein
MRCSYSGRARTNLSNAGCRDQPALDLLCLLVLSCLLASHNTGLGQGDRLSTAPRGTVSARVAFFLDSKKRRIDMSIADAGW